MRPIKGNHGGRVSIRTIAGLAVLSVCLAISAWLLQHGRIIAAWLIGAAGFSLAALIAGHEIEPD